MIATVTIGTVMVQGTLVRRLPGGRARVVVRGRTFTGRLVPRLRRIALVVAVAGTAGSAGASGVTCPGCFDPLVIPERGMVVLPSGDVLVDLDWGSTALSSAACGTVLAPSPATFVPAPAAPIAKAPLPGPAAMLAAALAILGTAVRRARRRADFSDRIGGRFHPHPEV
jgi:hypothetical protein